MRVPTRPFTSGPACAKPKPNPLMSIDFLLCSPQPPRALPRSPPAPKESLPAVWPVPLHHHHHHQQQRQQHQCHQQQQQSAGRFARGEQEQAQEQATTQPRLNGPPLANGAMLVIQNNAPVLVFVCRLCGGRFDTEGLLVDHTKASHKTELGQAGGGNANGVHGLKASAAAKSGGKCKWPGCTKHFSRSDQLMLHVRTHTNERPHKCATCGRGFAQSGDLVRHERTHSGGAPYTCALCNRSFHSSNALRRHELVHSGFRTHRCAWPGCGAAFAQKHDLKTHLRVHAGDRPFACGWPGCGRRFADESGLRSHFESTH